MYIQNFLTCLNIHTVDKNTENNCGATVSLNWMEKNLACPCNHPSRPHHGRRGISQWNHSAPHTRRGPLLHATAILAREPISLLKGQSHEISSKFSASFSRAHLPNTNGIIAKTVQDRVTPSTYIQKYFKGF